MPVTPRTYCLNRLHRLMWISLLMLAGCSSAQPPVNGPSMAAVYEEALGTASLEPSSVQPLVLPIVSVSPTSHHYAAQDFPRLPNPDIRMTVLPHLAGPDAVPIPRYDTVFPLYTRVWYALPGEVPQA